MILRAAWVLPIAGPPVRDGYVQIAADRIVAVGAAHDLPPDAEVTDLREVALLPGLVNAHVHLELTSYCGRIAPATLWEWFQRIIPMRAAPGQVEREAEGVRAGAQQALQAGTTCVADISRLNLHWPVLRELPLRKICFVELLSVADLPPRNPDELRAAVQAIAEDPLLTAGITPHAPYTVPVDHLRAALLLAAEIGRPWCVHWAESREECAFLRGDDSGLPEFLRKLLVRKNVAPPQMGTIELLQACTQGAGNGLLAHCNYLEPEEIESLANSGHTVVYCPRSHHFFNHPPHPWQKLRAAGGRVAIGTDSAASNDNLALLEELRFVRRHVADSPAPLDLLELVTRIPAQALGLDEQVGTLAPGKQADLAAFPCSSITADPAAAIIDAAPAATGVWIAGNRII